MTRLDNNPIHRELPPDDYRNVLPIEATRDPVTQRIAWRLCCQWNEGDPIRHQEAITADLSGNTLRGGCRRLATVIVAQEVGDRIKRECIVRRVCEQHRERAGGKRYEPLAYLDPRSRTVYQNSRFITRRPAWDAYSLWRSLTVTLLQEWIGACEALERKGWWGPVPRREKRRSTIRTRIPF